MEVTSKHTAYTQMGQISDEQKLFDPNLTVSIARTVQEVESLRNIWEAMQPSPSAGIDYLLTSIKFYPDAIRPHVIVVYRQGKPDTMLVGVLNNTRTEIKIKGRVIFRLSSCILNVALGGIMGNMAQANCAVIMSELNKSLKRREIEAVHFDEISTESHIYQLAQKVPGYLFRDHCPREEDHYSMTLPPSLDAFYSSLNSKQRHNFRTTVKKLDKTFAGKVSIKQFRAVTEVDQFCREAEMISQKSWQTDIGVGFTNDIATRKLLAVCAEKNQFIGFILYIEDRPCAFNYGYIHKNAFCGEYTGYDLQYRNHGVGTVLMINVIEAACNDPDIKILDFGWMGSDYKDRYCDQVWREADFYLFQPTFKGAMMNGVRTLLKKHIPHWRQKLDQFKRHQDHDRQQSA